MTQIPPALIGTTAPILDAHYTHAELNALFMQAGFPGDPPEGNKTQKCLSWLRRANAECAEPLSLFGTLIAEMMDVEPTPWWLFCFASAALMSASLAIGANMQLKTIPTEEIGRDG